MKATRRFKNSPVNRLQMKLVGLIFTLLIVLSVGVLACKSAYVKETLLEGESRSYTVFSETYDVELTFTDSDEAKFVVNGEATNKLKVGEIFSLGNNFELEVITILYQSFAGGVHSASFEIRKIIPASEAIIPSSQYEIVDSVKDSLLDEQSKEYILDGNVYPVTVLGLNYAVAEFRIADERTDTIRKGQTFTHQKKSLEIQITNIVCENRLENANRVEFEFRRIKIPKAEELQEEIEEEDEEITEEARVIDDKKDEPNEDNQKKKPRRSRRNSSVEEPLPTPEPAVEVIYLDDININNENTETVEKDSFLERLFSKLKSWFK